MPLRLHFYCISTGFRSFVTRFVKNWLCDPNWGDIYDTNNTHMFDPLNNTYITIHSIERPTTFKSSVKGQLSLTIRAPPLWRPENGISLKYRRYATPDTFLLHFYRFQVICDTFREKWLCDPNWGDTYAPYVSLQPVTYGTYVVLYIYIYIYVTYGSNT